MIISSYLNKDLEQLVVLWNSVFDDKYDVAKFQSEQIDEQNFDPELCLIAKDEAKVVGFIFGMKRRYPYFSKGLQGKNAWIKAMAVATEYQNKGIGEGLLSELERRLIEKGTNIIDIAMYSPNYFFPGIQENWQAANSFFIKYKYQAYERAYWMEMSLLDYTYPSNVKQRKADLELSGFSFRPYNESDVDNLLLMVKNNFSDSWYHYVKLADEEGRAKETIFLVLFNNEVVGYVSRMSIDHNPCRFGPFGVDKTYRNHHLGEVLFHEMMQIMKDRNLELVFFKSTEEHGKRFYQRNGMKVARVFDKYQKIITCE